VTARIVGQADTCDVAVSDCGQAHCQCRLRDWMRLPGVPQRLQRRVLFPAAHSTGSSRVAFAGAAELASAALCSHLPTAHGVDCFGPGENWVAFVNAHFTLLAHAEVVARARERAQRARARHTLPHLHTATLIACDANSVHSNRRPLLVNSSLIPTRRLGTDSPAPVRVRPARAHAHTCAGLFACTDALLTARRCRRRQKPRVKK
jgi:hypothetical protein